MVAGCYHAGGAATPYGFAGKMLPGDVASWRLRQRSSLRVAGFAMVVADGYRQCATIVMAGYVTMPVTLLTAVAITGR